MTRIHPLAAWRHSHKPRLTQEAAGVELGVSGMTIMRWESGDILPRKNTWPRIREVTGLNWSDFMLFRQSKVAA